MSDAIVPVPDDNELDQARVKRRQLELELTLLKYVADTAKGRYDEVREYLRRTTDAGNSYPTIETGDPLDVGPVEIGSIVHTRARKALTVTDPAAFGKWLMAEYPDECEVTAKKPFMQRLRDLTKQAGGRVAGPKGETEIPGLTIQTGGDYVYAKPNPDLMPTLFAQMRERLPLILEARGE